VTSIICAKKCPTTGSPPNHLRIIPKRVKKRAKPRVAPMAQNNPAEKYLAKMFTVSFCFHKN